MKQVSIGGNRLGSGNDQKVTLKGFRRSNHDLGYVWRSTMSAGTLVPFLCEVALPGDTFEIKLAVDMLTHPTIGPLFATAKIQLDIYQIPIRLYNAKLHMNALGIGMDMGSILFPQIDMEADPLRYSQPLDNQQINPSAIFSYLGIRGIGWTAGNVGGRRQFNAIPYLGYWDIYKNYYANKQEETGAVIHKNTVLPAIAFTAATLVTPQGNVNITVAPGPPIYVAAMIREDSTIELSSNIMTAGFDPRQVWVNIQLPSGANQTVYATDLFEDWSVQTNLLMAIGGTPTRLAKTPGLKWGMFDYENPTPATIDKDPEPEIVLFPLKNIDDERMAILTNAGAAYVIHNTSRAPYGLALERTDQGGGLGSLYAKQFSQEGLALKTYQSDLFNNWISTEWIDGPDGISAVTAIDTSDGNFTIDELNLSKKIYDMLNRIALSGGSYDDWLDAVYDHDRQRSAESPIYLGGMIQTLVFQEVIGTAATPDQPLGTLAGRGKVGGKKKGGSVTAKIDEPSILMGIISITPYIDYSQGNKWDTNLKTMDDLHKPNLDEIGFQDLITDQMAWWDTQLDLVGPPNVPIFKSAGKQPAWINYMTNVNQVRGNFADQTQQMFMTFNRRYSPKKEAAGPVIMDLTTYIDPTKFNHIFADTRRDAQNFWAQIGVDMNARRKMSAKVIPNL